MTDQLKEMISDALDVHSQGDQIDWDLGSGMGPDNQLFHFLTLVAPSPILGETIMAGGMIVGFANVKPEQLASLVQQALEQIRQARSAKLSEELPKQTQAGPGLVLP